MDASFAKPKHAKVIQQYDYSILSILPLSKKACAVEVKGNSCPRSQGRNPEIPNLSILSRPSNLTPKGLGFIVLGFRVYSVGFRV